MSKGNTNSERELYNELSYYTLSHPDPSFTHQHIVDAFTAQTADENSKPIGVVFALAGLYLYVEKNFTGKQVQQAHTKTAGERMAWPKITPPKLRGKITVAEVMNVPAGKQRDVIIRTWCESVWEAWKESRAVIVSLVTEVLEIE
ncbi:MAG: hypothetical protein KGJ59_01625 [Bacteroidota bacterium]|nr:hypothetical protein [Bacteroidota bacterium]